MPPDIAAMLKELSASARRDLRARRPPPDSAVRGASGPAAGPGSHTGPGGSRQCVAAGFGR